MHPVMEDVVKDAIGRERTNRYIFQNILFSEKGEKWSQLPLASRFISETISENVEMFDCG